jgi:hypothetical protein
MNNTFSTYRAEIDYRADRIRRSYGPAAHRHNFIPRVRRQRGAGSVR